MKNPTAGGASDGLKQKLHHVEGELAELRDDRKTKAAALESAKEAFAGSDGHDTSTDEFKNAEQAVRALADVDEAIADHQLAQVGILRMLGQDDPAAGAREKARSGAGGEEITPAAWSAKGMLADTDLRAELEHHSATKAHLGERRLGELIDRDALAADVNGTTQQRVGPFYGVVPQIHRPLRVLDLIPTGTMDNNSFYYTQEGGTFLAAETTEGSSKPEDGVTYTDALATAETIAAWQKIRKQVLSDVSALQSILENRLRYSVLRRLEAEVLGGNGTPPNIQGILGTSGVGAVSHGVDLTDTAPGMDLILVAMTKVILADAYPSAIVMHPTDWSEALRSKATGDGQYFSNGPFSITGQTMWGLPLIPSPAIPLGEALIGDFSIGAQLFIREGVNVLLSDSDGSDFTQNRVTILAEMRAALAVWRPAAFCTALLKEIS